MENFINNAPFIVVLLCLIVGFVFLVKGADLFVEGSSSVAKRFKVPSLIMLRWEPHFLKQRSVWQHP